MGCDEYGPYLSCFVNESMLKTLERLIQQEYTRVLQQGEKLHAADEKDQA
jgi:copper homeostasis protein CutC